MRYLQYLSFEISCGCNLALLHSPTCPIGQRIIPKDGYVLTDTDICEVAKKAYSRYGFQGMIAWHFYNEPVLEWDRMIRLMETIKRENIQAQFSLWTNGELLERKMKDELGLFSQIRVSRYSGIDFNWLHETTCPSVTIEDRTLDMRTLRKDEDQGGSPCLRIFNELIFDYFGYAHPCCMDWENRISLGKLGKLSFETIYDFYIKFRSQVFGRVKPEMTECRKCLHRNALGNLVPEVYETIRKEVL